MTNPTPPCPKCGVVPPWNNAQIGELSIECRCENEHGTCMDIPAWQCGCNQILGRALSDNHGVHTLAELGKRLAPDPRVAVCDKLGVLNSEEVEILIDSYREWSEYRSLHPKQADLLRNLSDAAERGEGV